MPPAFRPEPFGDGLLLSVVVPVFNEIETLPALYARLTAALAGLGVEHEIVFVDDGSGDGSDAYLDHLADADPTVAVLHLSRNFGHQPAVTAGLRHARGDAAVVLDADLQDPPEVIGELVEKWREGFDVVYAVRTRRKEGPARRAAYGLFYRLLRRASPLDVPLDSGDFCLLDRCALDALNRLPETDRFVRGLRAFIGFRQVGVRYERDRRAAGRSKYTLGKLFDLAVTGFVTTGGFPARGVAAGVGGFGVVAVGFAAAVAARAMAFGEAPAGWAVALAAVLLVATAQFAALAVIAAGGAKMVAEIKGRPPYILRDVRRAGPGGRPDRPHRRAESECDDRADAVHQDDVGLGGGRTRRQAVGPRAGV